MILGGTHPANGLPYRAAPHTCGTCRFYDATMWSCRASQGQPTTDAKANACIRWLPQGIVGHALRWIQLHSRAALGMIVGGPVAVASVVAYYALR